MISCCRRAFSPSSSGSGAPVSTSGGNSHTCTCHTAHRLAFSPLHLCGTAGRLQLPKECALLGCQDRPEATSRKAILPLVSVWICMTALLQKIRTCRAAGTVFTIAEGAPCVGVLDHLGRSVRFCSARHLRTGPHPVLLLHFTRSNLSALLKTCCVLCSACSDGRCAQVEASDVKTPCALLCCIALRSFAKK